MAADVETNEPSPPSERSLTPPGASPLVFRWARKVVSPIEAFLGVEASSGVVLLVTAVLALAIANSTMAEAFHHVLELPVGLHIGTFSMEQSLHFLVNDGLMTIFFFVVGLEIRREIHAGELSNVRRALLPVGAAVGGMIVPALLYLAIAGHHPVARAGWGVPMATDIAFAVGILALLGKRVPPALRVLLLALAIIDDIGSILVIAMFYSGTVSATGLVVAMAGIACVLVLQRIGIRNPWLYVPAGIVVWFGVWRSGVHPTIAGVVVGLLTPAQAWIGREALAPAKRLQTALHPWVAFGIMPIFALANAGVTLSGSAATPSLLSAGIVVGLVAGKPIGILAACFLLVRTKIAMLPRGVGWRELSVLGLVAGIGFTMALFVAALAFGEGAKLEQAKAAILAASLLAMMLGLVGGRLLLRPTYAIEAARTAEEAECSDVV